ncbi:MAG TPA: ABC transporter permease [Pyrinomonadaceae bacterium]|nr:ABC transporter permease [Pyrinomonadaceae bacterium]
MKKIIAQAGKELRQFSRDKLTVTLALILPMVLMWLIGMSISLSVTDLPVVVKDMDQSPASRRYVEKLGKSLTFRIVPGDLRGKTEAALDKEQARAVVVIPENFGSDLEKGRSPEIQWLVDGTDANTANIMRGNAAALTESFNSQLASAPVPAIQPHIRYWFNPGNDSDQYIGPAVFAVGLALFPPLLAALALSREGEQKTILQVYVSSIKAHEYLLGKIIAYMLVSIAQWLMTLIFAIFLFGIWFKGDPTPLLVSSVLYLFCNVALGVMMGATIPDQAAAIQAVQNVAFLLSYLLSGFVFPLSNIPPYIRWISNLVPARWFVEMCRDAFVRGGGWEAVWHVPVVLGLLSAAFFFRAWKVLRKMQVEA